jgi:hypothetical protein
LKSSFLFFSKGLVIEDGSPPFMNASAKRKAVSFPDGCHIIFHPGQTKLPDLRVRLNIVFHPVIAT